LVYAYYLLMRMKKLLVETKLTRCLLRNIQWQGFAAISLHFYFLLVRSCVLCVSASIGWCRSQNNILSKSMPIVLTTSAFSFFFFLLPCRSLSF
jgi:hypothetical protein